jgi:hypothetical protein
MRAIRRTAGAVVIAMGVAAGCFAAPALADFAVLTSTMKGANEIPAADPTATGTATVILDSATGRVCYFVVTTGLPEPVTAGHIHMGAAGTAGPVVIPFSTPTHGFTIGCTTALLPLVQSIIDNPSGFYTNVHDAQFPAGAIRGQLSALAVVRTSLSASLPAGLLSGLPAGVPAGLLSALQAKLTAATLAKPHVTKPLVTKPLVTTPHVSVHRHRHHHGVTVRTPQVFVHVG